MRARSRGDRPARGTPNAARAGLSASSSATIHSQADGASSSESSGPWASTIAIVRSSPASACCWSSMRVSPSRNHAPSTRPGCGKRAASAASDCARTASPATHVARSAIGSRRSASRAPPARRATGR